MAELNYKHLRYFWMVAKTGSIVRASEQLHLTPQSISGQLNEFETRLGVTLFHRSGRNLKLSDTGRRILGMAEEIFTLGNQLVDALYSNAQNVSLLRIGISDSVSKSMAYRLIEPTLRLSDNIRLVCHEGLLSSLLADLSIHRLDMIIADQPLPGNLNVRGYSHLLGESPVSVFGSPSYIKTLSGKFPGILNSARFLLPGEDFAIRPKLEHWFSQQNIHPHIIGEFDDNALIKAFGKAGAGLFISSSVIADDICEQYKVEEIGRIDSITEQHYIITTERKLTHPAIIEINKSARKIGFARNKAKQISPN